MVRIGYNGETSGYGRLEEDDSTSAGNTDKLNPIGGGRPGMLGGGMLGLGKLELELLLLLLALMLLPFEFVGFALVCMESLILNEADRVGMGDEDLSSLLLNGTDMSIVDAGKLASD